MGFNPFKWIAAAALIAAAYVPGLQPLAVVGLTALGLLTGYVAAQVELGRARSIRAQRYVTTKDTNAPHPVVYGQAKIGTIAHDYLVDTTARYDSILYMPLTLCHGSRDGFGIAEIGNVYFNGERAVSAANPVGSPIYPYRTRTVGNVKMLGTMTQNLATQDIGGLAYADPKSMDDFATWDNTDKGAGLAAILFRLRYMVKEATGGTDDPVKKVFMGGRPPSVACVVKGNFVEDHRDEVSGVNITFADDDPDTITRASGDFTAEGWTAGDRVAVTGSAQGGNNTSWTIASVAAGALTLDAGDALTASGPEAGVVLKRWAHPDNGGDNPAMCLRDYLLSAIYGPGFPESMINETSFEAAADLCDTEPGGEVTGKWFTCNGVLDTGRTVGDNRDDLLTSCRGNLIWQGGQFSLWIRTTGSPTGDLNLTEDNIIGDWSFGVPGLTEKFNIGRATYIEPGSNVSEFKPRDAQWPAPAAANSYLTADNSFENWLHLYLPFVNSHERAQYIIQTILKESRAGITAEVTCTEEALRLVVGDIVNVTHSTPGWSSKDFWVTSVGIAADSQVRLGLAEYDSTAYTVANLVAQPTEPGTQVGTPEDPAPPTDVILTFNLAESTLYATWTAPDYYAVDHYEVQSRHLTTTGGDGNWRNVIPKTGPVVDTSVLIYGVKHGQQWEVRVRAVNTRGNPSAWATSSTFTVDSQVEIAASVQGTANGVEVTITTWNEAARVEVYARENAASGGAEPLETFQYHATTLLAGDTNAFLIAASAWVRFLLVPFNVYGERGVVLSGDSYEAQSGATGAGPTAPPNTFAAPSSDYESVDLTWVCGDASSETRVYVDGTLWITLAATDAAETISGLAANRTFVFVLRHFEDGIENPIDNSVTVSKATTAGTLGTPTNLTVETIDPASVKITWAEGSPAGGGWPAYTPHTYTIQRSDTDVWGGEEVNVVTGLSSTTFEYTDLERDDDGETWYFKVKAVAVDAGWSDSALTASVSGVYGVDGTVDQADGYFWDDGEGPGDETHTISWTTDYADDNDHHIRIMRNTDGAGFVEVTDDLSIANNDGDDPWGRPCKTYHGLAEGSEPRNKYQYKVILEEDGGDVEVDSAETGFMQPKPE
jgi:hypothetical protein